MLFNPTGIAFTLIIFIIGYLIGVRASFTIFRRKVFGTNFAIFQRPLVCNEIAEDKNHVHVAMSYKFFNLHHKFIIHMGRYIDGIDKLSKLDSETPEWVSQRDIVADEMSVSVDYLHQIAKSQEAIDPNLMAQSV